jgi:hypothetical protein
MPQEMRPKRVAILPIERQCWSWSGTRRLCRAPNCTEPAFYQIFWPKLHVSVGFAEMCSDRCADHALIYARRYALPFPGLKVAA